MTDIVDDLRKYAMRVVDGSATFCEAPRELLESSAREIERLRSQIDSLRLIVGAVDAGTSFRDIKTSFGDNPVLGKFTGETHGS
jgi:hypothetical protein